MWWFMPFAAGLVIGYLLGERERRENERLLEERRQGIHRWPSFGGGKKGFIASAETEKEERNRETVEKNDREGKPTHISELL